MGSKMRRLRVKAGLKGSATDVQRVDLSPRDNAQLDYLCATNGLRRFIPADPSPFAKTTYRGVVR
jgi:hypothetical protein